jgi:hypothetical protein
MTAASGIERPGGTGMGLLCADMDNDGDQDIVVSNDTRPNFYFRNDGRGRFTECALALGLAYSWEGSTEAFMGIEGGDYDGDGLLDLVIPCLRTEGFSLFRNLGGMFADHSIGTGLDAATSAVTGFAPVLLDYDADGDPDLFCSTGEVRMGRTSARAGASFTERYAMADLLLENRAGRFVDVSPEAGPALSHRAVSRSVSAGDYDDDGDLDLLITALSDEVRLLRNDTPGGHWIGVWLRGAPPNTDAVGARVRLTAGGRAQIGEVTAGGSYLGQRDRRLLFGIGVAAGADELRVRWPGGAETVLENLEGGQYHEIEQRSP